MKEGIEAKMSIFTIPPCERKVVESGGEVTYGSYKFFRVAVMVIERKAVTEVFAMMKEWEDSPVITEFVSEQELVEAFVGS